ncbi:hypothetical protein [Brevibacillus sp. NRS-1366]|uniref:hypothetical protein n=1 Tax=Brevibacillus sp. NRS-1366 TaxID=3233899 RepID=UPI003D1B8823
MEDLLDLVFDLFGWVLPLIGKFWFVILAYLGYKVFGKGGKKMTQGKLPRTLTPVSDPKRFPVSPPSEVAQERKAVRASVKYEPIQPESMEGVGVEQEWAFAEPTRASNGPSLRVGNTGHTLPSESKQAALQPLKVDPREGMKWALIFGEPRSKAPYASPASRKRNA